MSRKYKHILLPQGLVGQPQGYASNRNGRDIQNLPGFPNARLHKSVLSNKLSGLKEYSSDVKGKRKIASDKDFAELKIKYQGHANKKLIEKYQVSVYRKYDDKPAGQEYSNDVVIGKVRNTKLPSQHLSSFEMLTSDFEGFIHTDELKSFFGNIEDIRPLNEDSIISGEVKKNLSDAGSSKVLMDIVFGDNQELSQEKMTGISGLLGSSYVSTINTRHVHYCRVMATKPEVTNILASYGGIIGIEEPPFVIFGSGIQSTLGQHTIEDISNGRSILVLDHPVCTNHPIISPLSDSQTGNAYLSGGDSHGTQVASLVIYGSKISTSGKLTGRNRVKPINIFPIINGKPMFDENAIINALKQNYSPDSVLIANFSVNDYGSLYNRKVIHRLTTLFDGLAVDYNCLFVISAGNLFQGWTTSECTRICSIGYPDYFSEDVTTILPPADSINNLTVGSIAYQSSPNSLAPIKEPTPITRRGFNDTNGFYFIKPDLVNYDSNFDSSYHSEDNGPFMAYPDNSLIREAGTSFATPLTTNQLGILAQTYPEYSANTLKALMIHFAEPLNPSMQVSPKIIKSLVGHGIPDIEKALYSLNTSSTVVIEDKIIVGTKKRIKFPVPGCLSGSIRKRLRIRQTLVYNPIVNNTDVRSYNPILLTARLLRNDGKAQNNATSRRIQDGAFRKSNVKIYNPIDRNTISHMGAFWEIEVTAEHVDENISAVIEQPYSIIVTTEDIQKDDSIDIHEEVQQMIEVEIGVEVAVEVVTN